MTDPSEEKVRRADQMRISWEEGRQEGMEMAAKIVEEHLIYGNRENPEWAQRIIAGEIRRRASELG